MVVRAHAFFLVSLLSCCFAVSDQIVQGAISTKIFYFHVVGLFLTLLLIVSKAITKKVISFSKLDVGITTYFVYTIARVLLNPTLLWHAEQLLTIILLLSSYFFFKHCLQHQRLTVAALSSLLLVSWGQVVYGGLQWGNYLPSLHPNLPVSGSFFNPAPYAGFLVTIFPIALVVTLKNDSEHKLWTLNKVLRMLAVLVAVGTVVLLPITQSRAAWIAAIVGIIVVISHRFHLIHQLCIILNSWFKRMIALLISLITTGSLIVGLFYLRPDSVLGRLLISKINLRIIADNPWWGVGYGQYQTSFGKYQIAYFEQHPDDPLGMWSGNGEYAFNMLLQIAVEQGLIGLILFVIVITLALWTAFRSDNGLAVGAGASLLALFTFGMFSYPFSVLPIHIVFFFLLALLSAQQNNCKIFVLAWPARLYPIFSAGIVILLGALAHHDMKRYFAYEDWNIANQYSAFFNFQEANTVYAQIYPILRYDGHFLLQYGQSLYYDEKYTLAATILEEAKDYTTNIYLYTALGSSYQAQQQYTAAEANFKAAAYLNPYRFYPKYLLAQLYEATYDTASAVATAQEVLHTKVKVPSQTVKHIQKEMRLLIDRHHSNSIYPSPLLIQCGR